MASLKSAVKRVINIEHISRLFTDENEELYGNFTYLYSIDNFRNVFSRHQLRKHLQKRGEEDTGSKRKLCERLKLSIQREKEQRAKESEEAKAAFHQAKSMEEAGSVYIVGKIGMPVEKEIEDFPCSVRLIPALRGVRPHHVTCGGNNVYCVTVDNIVYTWEVDISKSQVSEPRIVKDLIGEEISHVATSSNFGCASSLGGDYYRWGRLGLGHVRNQPELCIDMPESEHVIQTECGERHCMLLTLHGNVFSWGIASDGRLGTVEESTTSNEDGFSLCPTNVHFKIPNDGKIVKISCGALHTLALSSSGLIYSWGSGAGGRLGHGDCSDRWTPTPIQSLENLHCSDIAAGTWHSCCVLIIPPLKNGGHVFSFGSGLHGQLGQGEITSTFSPSEVKYFHENCIAVQQIFSGSHHCAAIASCGSIYTWGSNLNDCLGHETLKSKFGLNFTGEPGLCYGKFGDTLSGIGRGLPRSICCGKGFTIIACNPYNMRPSEVNVDSSTATESSISIKTDLES